MSATNVLVFGGMCWAIGVVVARRLKHYGATLDGVASCPYCFAYDTAREGVHRPSGLRLRDSSSSYSLGRSNNIPLSGPLAYICEEENRFCSGC